EAAQWAAPDGVHAVHFSLTAPFTDHFVGVVAGRPSGYCRLQCLERREGARRRPRRRRLGHAAIMAWLAERSSNRGQMSTFAASQLRRTTFVWKHERRLD